MKGFRGEKKKWYNYILISKIPNNSKNNNYSITWQSPLFQICLKYYVGHL